MCDRFSADGFRTRAVRVIRWRELGFGRPMGETGKERGGRPGGSWALGKRCGCVGVRSVSAGRGPEGRFSGGDLARLSPNVAPWGGVGFGWRGLWGAGRGSWTLAFAGLTPLLSFSQMLREERKRFSGTGRAF